MIISTLWINIQWLIWSTIFCKVSCYFSAHLAPQPYKYFNNQQNQELYYAPTIPLTQSILLELTCSLVYTSCKFAHTVVFVEDIVSNEKIFLLQTLSTINFLIII